jgi:hypothetical protein
MVEKFIKKIGYYTLSEIKDKPQKKFKVDSGETLYLARFKKTIVNPYRDLKYFETLDDAVGYVKKKLSKKSKAKKKILKTLPKSLYLVLIKEKSTNIVFVKVGFTTKKFIYRRFSKEYGYDGYVLESILRRVNTPDAEKLEEQIKDKLNKKRSVKKYRPIMENFSGYSECYDYLCLSDIVKIFDKITNIQG